MYIKKLALLTLIFFTFTNCSNQENKELKFYGNVDVRTVSLSFRVPGRIDHVNFEEGQKIKRGDALASLDNTLYKESAKQAEAQIKLQDAKLQKLQNGYRKELIEKAKASLDQKQVVLENAKKNYVRYQKLSKSKSISQEDFDKAKTTYESALALYNLDKSSLELLQNGYDKEDILAAQAQLEFLKSQYRQRVIDLNDTVIYAPSDGTVLTRVYEEGSIINPSATVLEIAKDDSYWVRSYVSEKYLGNIKRGMKALISTDSTKTYEGVVSFISPIAEFTPKSVQTEDLRTDLVYRFRITLNSYDDMIKQGMPVTITFPDLHLETK